MTEIQELVLVLEVSTKLFQIGFEVGAPNHGRRAEGMVKVADSGLLREKFNNWAPGGPEPAEIEKQTCIQKPRKY